MGNEINKIKYDDLSFWQRYEIWYDKVYWPS